MEVCNITQAADVIVLWQIKYRTSFMGVCSSIYSASLWTKNCTSHSRSFKGIRNYTDE